MGLKVFVDKVAVGRFDTFVVVLDELADLYREDERRRFFKLCNKLVIW